MSSRHIMVGMSGGVDSSVAALLLKQQGHKVSGLFMKNWEEDDTDSYCAAAEDKADAERVCEKLGIDLHTVNFAAEYWDNVFEEFLSEYKAGRTPNPDILCNREIKFKCFLEYAVELGADAIATGHYVQRADIEGAPKLLKGLDSNKDQSYFLYAINQSALEKSVFPIGHLLKPEVRKIAAEAGLINHSKKDSTGICFIGERRFKDFLETYIPNQPGLIEDDTGQVVGEHSGLMYYTLGQRQGLGIGGSRASNGEPWYVASKDLERNVLVAVQGKEHPLLYSDKLEVLQESWIGDAPDSACTNLTAKIRYRSKDVPVALIRQADGTLIAQFQTPQMAITPGQSVVFYQDDVCLGGGIIA